MSFRPIGHASDTVVITPFMGHVALATRLRPEGNRIVGEGRAWHYDHNGVLVKDTGWQPTGIYLYWDEEEPKKWWEFWK